DEIGLPTSCWQNGCWVSHFPIPARIASGIPFADSAQTKVDGNTSPARRSHSDSHRHRSTINRPADPPNISDRMASSRTSTAHTRIDPILEVVPVNGLETLQASDGKDSPPRNQNQQPGKFSGTLTIMDEEGRKAAN